MIKPAWAVFLMVCACALPAMAQTNPADSATFASAVNYAVDYYNKAIDQQSEIYNGPEYNYLPRATKGSPFWADNASFSSGSIKYNGTWYNNVGIAYDVYKGQVLAAQPVSQIKFVLHEHLLSDFIVSGHHFIRINVPDSVKLGIKPGYYEMLYNGKTQVLCKRTKSRTEVTSTEGINVYFEDGASYYIKKDNIYYSVSSKNSALNVFKERKKELDKYLSHNNYDYSDNKELALIKLAAYYDQISH